MIRIDKKTHLRDSMEYEDYSNNIANLSNKEKEELGIKTCGGCCKTKKEQKSK
ncbi:hypothetical protein [Clostridium sp.]|uniref:hypothetical protein n=1 Tax=Clostridium sp. TaxID=1506 RepID=UPI002FCA4082